MLSYLEVNDKRRCKVDLVDQPKTYVNGVMINCDLSSFQSKVGQYSNYYFTE